MASNGVMPYLVACGFLVVAGVTLWQNMVLFHAGDDFHLVATTDMADLDYLARGLDRLRLFFKIQIFTIVSALSLLRSDGTMLIMASDGSHSVEDAIESNTADTDVVVVCKRTAAWHNHPCIVARNDSPLAIRLRTVQSGLLPGSERILRLDPQQMDDLMARLCPAA